MAPKTYKDFESAMERLESITSELESGETRLEEAIKLYTEGLEIVRYCDKKLSEAEKKIKLIRLEDGKAVEEELNDEE